MLLITNEDNSLAEVFIRERVRRRFYRCWEQNVSKGMQEGR
jgi:hypothetical protein